MSVATPSPVIKSARQRLRAWTGTILKPCDQAGMSLVEVGLAVVLLSIVVAFVVKSVANIGRSTQKLDTSVALSMAKAQIAQRLSCRTTMADVPASCREGSTRTYVALRSDNGDVIVGKDGSELGGLALRALCIPKTAGGGIEVRAAKLSGKGKRTKEAFDFMAKPDDWFLRDEVNAKLVYNWEHPKSELFVKQEMLCQSYFSGSMDLANIRCQVPGHVMTGFNALTMRPTCVDPATLVSATCGPGLFLVGIQNGEAQCLPPPRPGRPEPTPLPPPIPSDCDNVPHRSATTTVNLASNRGAVCPWGQGDNLPKRDGRMAARIERRFPISIPQGRTVCSMTARSATQEIKYDDDLYLTLNGHVVMASTTNVTQRLSTAENGFPRYDWSRLRGLGSDKRVFFANGVSGNLPKTQQRGNVNFAIAPQASRRLFGSLQGQPLSFDLILTGDNNAPIDCQLYNDIRLKVDYTYVETQP
jgi:hypothetical protein